MSLDASPAVAKVPPSPGTYVVVLRANGPLRITAGRLGPVALDAGFYAYVGSALGPGGLRARVRHHLGVATRPHWHADYLRAATHLHEVWYAADPTRREHGWARTLLEMRGACPGPAGFGASDCACPTHLVRFPHSPSVRAFSRRLRRVETGVPAVRTLRLSPAAT